MIFVSSFFYLLLLQRLGYVEALKFTCLNSIRILVPRESSRTGIYHTINGGVRNLALKAKKRGGNQKRAIDDDSDEELDGLELMIDESLLADVRDLIRSTEDDLDSEDQSSNSDDLDDLGELDSTDEDDDEGIIAVDSVDDIIGDDEEEEDDATPPIEIDKWKAKVEDIIKNVVAKIGLFIFKLTWLPGRIELILSSSEDLENPIGPSIALLQSAHRRVYEELDMREAELAVVTKFEILVASPGIGEVLRTDQDFISFRGFTAIVTTKEEYKKKTKFEGTLVERTDENVCISLKGRIIKIPRELVELVRLPKPKYESTDSEMRKLK